MARRTAARTYTGGGVTFARGATVRLPGGPAYTTSASGRRRRAIQGSGVQYNWQGRKRIAQLDDILLAGLAALRERAIAYWRDEEWTESRHPYMTGRERDSGFFEIYPENNRATFVFGASAPWALFEEFGTVHQPAHYPIRNTLDRVAYRAAAVIREAARQIETT